VEKTGNIHTLTTRKPAAATSQPHLQAFAAGNILVLFALSIVRY